MGKLQRISAAHGAVAQFCLNLAICFVVVNAMLYPVQAALEDDPVTGLYGNELVYAAYPHLSAAEVDELLAETWHERHVYRRFTQYREGPATGHWVNVDPAGFRYSADQGPWPPDPEAFNVFLFGGSTLFGYGVADWETIPSRLQEILAEEAEGRPLRCYNFGQGAYYSTQERLLFGDLLAAGHRPDLAIFVDGLNDFFFESPIYTRRLERLFEDRPLQLVARSMRHLPALDIPLDWLEAQSRRASHHQPAIDPAYDQPEVLEARVERYLDNRHRIEALAHDAGVEPVFVIQPVPTYKYDLAHHPFAEWSFGPNSFSAYGYPLLEEAVGEPPAADQLWLADLQEGLSEPLYVDQIHYNEKMMTLIAREIADGLAVRGLLPADRGEGGDLLAEQP